jgi:hypothetical protein
MGVNWADELGIDLQELQREHPSHPDQLRLHRIISRDADKYWARERFLARLGDPTVPVVRDTLPEPSTPVKVKRAKVGRYDFTDVQLNIARASLNGKDRV